MNATQRQYETVIVWMRRELRVQDHLALWSAAHDARLVIPLFIKDPDPGTIAPARRRVIAEATGDVRTTLRRLGGDLFVRMGHPGVIIPKLIEETNASAVYVTKDYHPEAKQHDSSVRSTVQRQGKIWREFKDLVLFEEGEIVGTSTGKPYTVFTPYMHAWKLRSQEIALPLPRLRSIRTPALEPGALPFTSGKDNSRFPQGGERNATLRLRRFLKTGAERYEERRNVFSQDGTSRLSHHLAIGAISPRTVYHAIRTAADGLTGNPRNGVETFLRQLIWREFYYQILANFPRVAERSFKSAFDDIRWNNDTSLFEAWCEGRTGFPVVDAAMRQLKHEGWMHNRARMIVASFLTKDLHIDWRKGEDHFMQHLADGDVALNNGGWQWCAGTGNDAQPWFRIFNPVLQSKKFDPQGDYIRTYIPELQNVPQKYIHEPSSMPAAIQSKSGCLIGKDYPPPIVDHGRERERALELYGRISRAERPRSSNL